MIIIFGPTGVGKTDLAEHMAQQLPAEIINADLGQFYTPLSIGTAKPDWRNAPIAQHLFDTISEPRMMTVAEYRDQLIRVAQQIWDRNNLPIIVGGSGFYLKSLFFPPQVASISQTFAMEYAPEKERWKQLYDIDPERALKIHPNDLYRVNRALDIYFSTGKKPSEQHPRYQPLASFLFVYVTRDRTDLYERINTRTAQMLQKGWLEEVERLKHTSWEPFLKKKKFIGYDDILEYLDGRKAEDDYKQLVDLIARKTRNYAKRQITFGNQLYEQLEKMLLETNDTRSGCRSLNLTSNKLELYINQLLERIRLMHCFDNERREHV